MKIFALCMLACAAIAAPGGALAQRSDSVDDIIQGFGGGKPALSKNSEVDSIVRDLGGGSAPPASRGSSTFDMMKNKPVTRSWSMEEREAVEKEAVERPKRDFEVFFDYNSAEVTERAKAQLDKLGLALEDKRLSGRRFIFRGHTDAKGDANYNLRLSDLRAEAVKKYITGHFRVNESNIQSIGNGARSLKNPAAPFAEENRRVEVVGSD